METKNNIKIAIRKVTSLLENTLHSCILSTSNDDSSMIISSLHSLARQPVVRFFALVILVVSTRMWAPLLRLIPFGFDHGKDSIAILTMLVTHTPKLIGPWTSIPGVFFGPGWYYLLAPIYLLSKGDPSSAVWLLITVSLAQSLLVWKVWGFRAALLTSLVPMYIITSSSAWNPFPMTLISFAILAIAWRIAEKGYLSSKLALTVGAVAGMGFHFSAAFSIFYLPFAFALPLLFTTKKRLYRLLLIVCGLTLTFVPQLLFEVRHNFVETQSLIRYFLVGEPNAFSMTKIGNVLLVVSKEMSLGVFPGLNGAYQSIPIINFLIFLSLTVGFVVLFIRWWQSSPHWQKKWLISSTLFLIVLPIVGFFFLHFNVWYVYGMVPLLTLVAVFGLSRASFKVASLIIGIFVLISAWNVANYLTYEVPEHRLSRGMLLNRESTINSILTYANGKSFNVYSYVPDIYDFSYQYLWFKRAYLGQPLPVEFSYQPQTIDYVTDKPALLAQLPQQKGPAELQFYVIEIPHDPSLFDTWWSAQRPGKIIDTYMINQDIEVIVTDAQTQ